MNNVSSELGGMALREGIQQIVDRFTAAPVLEQVPQWILPPTSCELLAELARLLPPGSTAFEFGSGRSTHVLRHQLSGVTSVEDSRDWLAKTELLPDAIHARPADHAVVLPLRKCWNRFRLIESFDVEGHPAVLQRLRSARLVLVDSPPNPAKREHALFLALRHTPAGAIIVIDDLEVRATARFTERLAAQNTGAFVFWRLRIDHQLGIFVKTHSDARVSSVPTAREFIGTWLRA